MKGRFQAVVAAVFATGTVFFAWVGAAIIALVILRRGFYQGGYVLFWALLPGVLLCLWGDIGPLATLLGASLVAVVLRTTASWSWALMVASLSGVLTSVLLTVFGSVYLGQIVAILDETLAQVANQSAEQGALALIVPSKAWVAGLLGMSNAFSVAVCLVLARWWQALLYNPGGFKEEFLKLRLAPQLSVTLLAAGVGVATMGPDYRFWALIFAVPLVFAGFALAHAIVAIRQMGSHWLVVFYICWLLLDPLKILLLLTTVADSWLDIRARIAARS